MLAVDNHAAVGSALLGLVDPFTDRPEVWLDECAKLICEIDEERFLASVGRGARRVVQGIH